ncbi:MAG: DivIVA domain-containing protein [Deltaproteobacteria bacterium]|nr:DivIVA domain-containing protein [Deltaproteobacteria bacterium]
MDIYQQQFGKSFRGYNTDEVESFLEVVARGYEEISKENAILSSRVSSLEEQLQEYQNKEQRIHDSLLQLQKFVENSEDTAQKETELIVREAKIHAEQIVREANEKANKIREEIFQLETEKEHFIAGYRAFLQTQLKLITDIEGQSALYSNSDENESITIAENR